MLLVISGLLKISFNNKHLLSVLISLELINLGLIVMTWQFNWVLTLWIMIMSVIHSILGLLLLLLIIRYFGNDKSFNLY
uniref:NADH dehydrogenase subunit 4L n=1 Tax=Eucoleus annulatus TaxID=2831232 RepID=A0A8E8HU91_9BILA|nr:NADH dehydrogenase subunit 4L [Eucoleus annulatus]QWC93300.1 NADH dehydrogenase subunit 4L [Eucoleus annulatus]